MIPNSSIEVQTSPVDRPSIPAWFAEVVILSQHLTTKGLLEAFAHHIQFVRGRLGKAKRVRFKSRGCGFSSIENKRNDTSLRFVLQPPEAGNAGYLL
jgi:hypothetical protein